MTEENKQLRMQIEDAVKLHGHLGPFLVIGVRMGQVANRILDPQKHQHADLKVSVELHLDTPFSCTLDGIQSVTHCTIGNQRLTAKESRRKITARFEATDSDKILAITVNPEVIKNMTDRLSNGTSNENMADVIASAPESQLFKFNMVKKHGGKKH